MRIDPSGTYSPVSSTTVGTNASVNAAASRSADASASSIEDSTFTRTDGLNRLLQAVREVPEVRSEVVADIAKRLALGEFNTATAAADTAQSFVEQEGSGNL